jgi:hypothetical protein
MDEEEVRVVRTIHKLLSEEKIDDALELVTPEMAATGLIYGSNMLTWLCGIGRICLDLKNVEHIIVALSNKGYKYNQPTIDSFILYTHKPYVLNLMLIASGLCKSIQMLLAGRLSRITLELFFDRGCVLNKEEFDKDSHNRIYDFEEYLSIYKSRENARSVSVALINVGKQRRALDVMRVISRVVWGRRMDEEWESSQSLVIGRKGIY